MRDLDGVCPWLLGALSSSDARQAGDIHSNHNDVLVIAMAAYRQAFQVSEDIWESRPHNMLRLGIQMSDCWYGVLTK